MITSTRYPDVSSNVTWLTPKIDGSDSTARLITFKADENTATTSRTGYIYLRYNGSNATGKITVKQSGKTITKEWWIETTYETSISSSSIEVKIISKIKSNSTDLTIGIINNWTKTEGINNLNAPVVFNFYKAKSTDLNSFEDDSNYDTQPTTPGIQCTKSSNTNNLLNNITNLTSSGVVNYVKTGTAGTFLYGRYVIMTPNKSAFATSNINETDSNYSDWKYTGNKITIENPVYYKPVSKPSWPSNTYHISLTFTSAKLKDNIVEMTINIMGYRISSANDISNITIELNNIDMLLNTNTNSFTGYLYFDKTNNTSYTKTINNLSITSTTNTVLASTAIYGTLSNNTYDSTMSLFGFTSDSKIIHADYMSGDLESGTSINVPIQRN